MGIAPDVLLLVVVLLVQPLVAILYAYIAYRLAVRFATRRSGQWVDNRVTHIKQSIKEVFHERET